MTDQKLKRGHPQRGQQKSANLGVSVPGEVKDALQALADREGIKRSYLVEQLLRVYLEMPSDYDWNDLQLLKLGRLE